MLCFLLVYDLLRMGFIADYDVIRVRKLIRSTLLAVTAPGIFSFARPLALSFTMYTPTGPQRCTPSSLSPSESIPRTTPAPEYSQSSHGSPSDANIDRPGSTTMQLTEHPPLFDPYYHQYHGPGINTGTHLSYHSAPVLRHAQPYPSSNNTAYTWQGDGAGGGYRALYSPQTHPGGSDGSPVDRSTESLHASIAHIMAEMKGVVERVTSLCERQAELDKRTTQILTRIEGIEAQMKEHEGPVGEGTGARGRRSSGGTKGVSNEHPLLKVCRDKILPVPSVLKTPARGTHAILSDVWNRGVWEQRQTY